MDKIGGNFMTRVFIVVVLIVSLVIIGCNKKKDEIEALKQEATGEDVAAFMDSLEETGTSDSERAMVTPAAPQESTPPAESSPPATDYSQKQGFVLQIGSYRDYDLAAYMSKKYQDRAFPAFLQQVEVEGQTCYRLRIGVYDTYQEAKAVGELMADRYSTAYWIDTNR